MVLPSFDEYALARGPALVRFAFLLSGDWALAEDLAQEALISTHLKWRRIQKMEHPDAYVRRVVARRVLSWRRRRSSGERPAGFLHDTTALTGQESADVLAERDRVWTLLSGLPRRQRAVLVLRYYEDMPDAEIAHVLGLAQSTVRVHALRGLTALREVLPDSAHSLDTSR